MFWDSKGVLLVDYLAKGQTIKLSGLLVIFNIVCFSTISNNSCTVPIYLVVSVFMFFFPFCFDYSLGSYPLSDSLFDSRTFKASIPNKKLYTIVYNFYLACIHAKYASFLFTIFAPLLQAEGIARSAWLTETMYR